jgi:hypothetical protein
MKIEQNIKSQLILNNLNELLDDINKIYKIHDKYLIKFNLENGSDYINQINNNINKDDIKIKLKNNNIETYNYDDLDILFNNNEVLLIDNISLSEIWKNFENIKNKKTILQYLNVFYTIFDINNTSNKNENIDFFLKQFQSIFNDNENNQKDLGGENNQKDLGGENNQKDLGGENNQKDLGGENNQKDLGGENNENILHKLGENMLNNTNKEDMEQFSKDIENNIEKNKDNSIFKLAEEMSSELMNENLDLNQLLSGNNNNLMNVISNIGNKLQQKFESNDIKQEDLINDMNKFINDNDSMFKNIMDNFNTEMNNKKIIKKKDKKDKKDKKKRKKNKNT